MHQNNLAAGFGPAPLGDLKRSANPLAAIRGEGMLEGVGIGGRETEGEKEGKGVRKGKGVEDRKAKREGKKEKDEGCSGSCLHLLGVDWTPLVENTIHVMAQCREYWRH